MSTKLPIIQVTSLAFMLAVSGMATSAYAESSLGEAGATYPQLSSRQGPPQISQNGLSGDYSTAVGIDHRQSSPAAGNSPGAAGDRNPMQPNQVAPSSFLPRGK